LLIDMCDAPTCFRTSCLVSRIEPELDGAGGFSARGFELPFFHRLHRSTYKNRVTTDYFGFLDAAVWRNQDFELDRPTQPMLAGNLGIGRRHLDLDLAIKTALLRKTRQAECDS